MTGYLKFLTTVFCAALALALAVPTAMGQKTHSKEVEKIITQMEMKDAKSRLAGDSAWTKMLADDYSGGTSWGAWQTKPELVKNAADAANNKTSKWDVSDMKVRAYGENTAIATYRTSYDSVINGEHRSRKILTTDTWVKENGTWKVAAAHSSQADQKIGDN